MARTMVQLKNFISVLFYLLNFLLPSKPFLHFYENQTTLTSLDVILLATEQYRFVTVGLSDSDTEIRAFGPNISCSSTSKIIPGYVSNLPPTVDIFRLGSAAFSLTTSTLVVCGGQQLTVEIFKFPYFYRRNLTLNVCHPLPPPTHTPVKFFVAVIFLL